MTLFAIDLHRAPLVGSHLPETKIPAWALFMTVGFGGLVTGLALNHRTAKAIAYATGTLALTAASIDLLFHGEKSEETEEARSTGGPPPSTIEELPEHPWQLLQNMPEEGDEQFWKGVINHYGLKEERYARTCSEGIDKKMAAALVRQAAFGELSDLLGDARKVSELPLVLGDSIPPEQVGEPILLMLSPQGKPRIRFKYKSVDDPNETHSKLISKRGEDLFCGNYPMEAVQKGWVKDLFQGKKVEHHFVLCLGQQFPALERKGVQDLFERLDPSRGLKYDSRYELG